MKKYVLQIIVVFIVFLHSTELKAWYDDLTILNLSVGRTFERDISFGYHGTGSQIFKSDNTLCIDIGGGIIFSDERWKPLGGGIIGELGLKSINMASASYLLEEGKTRQTKFELSIGPAAYIGNPSVGLLISVQPSHWFGGKLFTSENSMVVWGSWGIKLRAELKLWYLTFGACYNPFDLRIYKPDTNTGLFSSSNAKFIYIKPAVEFRVGIMLFSDNYFNGRFN